MEEREAQNNEAAYGLDFEFDVDEEDTPQLGIHNDGQINRHLIVRDAVGKTSFNAVLDLVQYGTYDGKHACLIVIDISFRFKSDSHARYSYATIQATFAKAVDVKNHKVRSKDFNEDPQVVNLAPKEVYGFVETNGQKSVREVMMPAIFDSSIGLLTGSEATGGPGNSEVPEHRMEIRGDLYFDDDHTEAASGVIWDLAENPTLKEGIFRQFRAAIIVLTPSEQPFWVYLDVKPSLRLSLNPIRSIAKQDYFVKLLQRKDDPILLDGKKSSGRLVSSGIDFCAKEFRWDQILWLPAEYKSQLLRQLHATESSQAGEAVQSTSGKPPAS